MLPLTTPVLRIGLVCIGTPCRALRTWPLSCRTLLPSHSFRRPLPGLALGVRLLRRCRCRGGQAELSVSRVCCTHPFCGSLCGLHLRKDELWQQKRYVHCLLRLGPLLFLW